MISLNLDSFGLEHLLVFPLSCMLRDGLFNIPAEDLWPRAPAFMLVCCRVRIQEAQRLINDTGWLGVTEHPSPE